MRLYLKIVVHVKQNVSVNWIHSWAAGLRLLPEPSLPCALPDRATIHLRLLAGVFGPDILVRSGGDHFVR